MSKEAEQYRRESREKAHRLTRVDPKTRLDASDYTPPTELAAGVKTGMRPVSQRQFKKGGKVHGEHAHHHAGRKARKSGGLVEELVNRDMKHANEDRVGEKHDGGMKKGGRAHKDMGGANLAGAQLGNSMVPSSMMKFGMSAPGVMSRTALGIKKGGKVHHRASGGMNQSDTDTTTYDGRKAQPSDFNSAPKSVPTPPPLPKGLRGSPAETAQYDKRGGRVHHKAHGGETSHPDEREDKALIDKMVKKECRTGRKEGGANWIAGAIKHPGALHKELHVPEGKKIPAKKLAKAEHSHNPLLAKRAHLVETLKKMHKAAGGSAGDYDDYPSPKPSPNVPSSAYRRNPDGSVIEPKGYSVWNVRSGSKVGTYKDIQRARNAKDRKDNAYGAYAHSVVPEYKRGGEVVGNTEVTGTRPTGGRLARKDGGKTGKKGTQVNIVISTGKHPDSMMGAGAPSMPPMMPPRPPGTAPVAVPPSPMGAMGGAMPMPIAMPMGAAAAPPPVGVPPMRAEGGKVQMTAGSGGGEGRLEKMREYADEYAKGHVK